MNDIAFCGILCAANAVTCALNYAAFDETSETRDMAATIAWAGSTAYWFVRLLVEVMASTEY